MHNWFIKYLNLLVLFKKTSISRIHHTALGCGYKKQCSLDFPLKKMLYWIYTFYVSSSFYYLLCTNFAERLMPKVMVYWIIKGCNIYRVNRTSNMQCDSYGQMKSDVTCREHHRVRCHGCWLRHSQYKFITFLSSHNWVTYNFICESVVVYAWTMNAKIYGAIDVWALAAYSANGPVLKKRRSIKILVSQHKWDNLDRSLQTGHK